MAKLLRIIALRNNERDTEKAFKTLQKHTLMTCAWSLPELRLLLQGDRYDLFLCARSCPDATWLEAVEQVHKICPHLPAIVFSPISHDRELDEAAASGAVHVIRATQAETSLMALLMGLVPQSRRGPRSYPMPNAKPGSASSR